MCTSTDFSPWLRGNKEYLHEGEYYMGVECTAEHVSQRKPEQSTFRRRACILLTVSPSHGSQNPNPVTNMSRQAAAHLASACAFCWSPVRDDIVHHGHQRYYCLPLSRSAEHTRKKIRVQRGEGRVNEKNVLRSGPLSSARTLAQASRAALACKSSCLRNRAADFAPRKACLYIRTTSPVSVRVRNQPMQC